MALKNRALTITYVAWDTVNNVGKTGDSGNHTIRGVGDGSEYTPGGTPAQVDATNLKGVYKLALTAGEMNYNVVTLGGVSSTTGVVIVPITITTTAALDIENAVWDAILSGSSHNTNNSAGKQLRTMAGGAKITILSGTAQSGSTVNTIKLSTAASTADDTYAGALVVITGGTGLGQSRNIVNYVGSTRVATVDANWVTTPDNTSTFEVNASSGGTFSAEGVVVSATASTAVLDSAASATDDIYNTSLLSIVSGTGSGQTRTITDYVGSTKTATVDTNWSVNPDATSAYVVIPAGNTNVAVAVPTVEQIAAAILETPANLLATDSNGRVDVGSTAGSAAVQTSLPTNFDLFAIGASGEVTVGTLPDPAPSGYGGTGLDAAGTRAALGLASANLDAQLADIDADVLTRSTYAGADTSGTTTLLTRIPGTIQPQTGDAYALIGAAGAGLTALGDARLANLDAAISTRSTYAGGAVASVTAGVTVTTNNDKLGYSLSQSFPANFADLAITASTGRVTAGTVSDKTGYSLVAAGLDAVVVESGINARQAIAGILSTSCGKATGMEDNAPIFKGGGNTVTRVTAITDADGNRSSVTLTLPT